MKVALASKDFQIHTIDIKPSYGSQGLESLAAQLKNFILAIAPNNHSIALVGFSMGGIVARYYLQMLGGIQKVHQFISIASPHHGTLTAYLLPFKSCHQMRPSSEFLATLNQDQSILECTAPLSIWTPYDLVIIPSKSAIMGIGEQQQILVYWHRSMVTDTRVSVAVGQKLIHAL